MARNRSLKNPRSVTVIVEGDIYDKFMESLPKGTGTSEALRDVIHSMVEEYEKEKNLKALSQDAIKQINNAQSNIYILEQEKKQKSLDLFLVERRDIPFIINEIESKGELGMIQGLSKLITDCTKTRMTKL